MLSSKAALAIGTLAVGSAAFGAAVYSVADQQPHSDFVPPIATEHPTTPVDPPSIQEPAVVQLEPVTILGRWSRPASPAPAAARASPIEMQLVACSPWRELAVGPAARRVQNLCQIPLVPATGDTPSSTIPASNAN